MKKVLVIIVVLVLVGFVMIQSRESAPKVSIPTIPETTKKYDEAQEVEAYVRSADIATLTNTKPVLGGTWYYTDVVVNTRSDTVAIAYEDGHMAEKGVLSYSYDQLTNTTTVNGFTKSK